MYSEFWDGIFKELSNYFENGQKDVFEKKIPEIEEIVEDENTSYKGYLTVWLGGVESMTSGSSVFNHLKEEIDYSNLFKKKIFGRFDFRIQDGPLLQVSYQPITYEYLIKFYFQIQQERSLFEGEKYKWKEINRYQKLWQDYQEGRLSFEELAQSIRYHNLIYQGIDLPLLKDIAKENPEGFQRTLDILYDLEKPLQERIDTFQVEFEKEYRSFKSHVNKATLQERTLGTLLAYRYPDTYTFYKDSFYTKLCKGLDIKPKKAGYKLAHYYELVDEFCENYISRSEQLKKFKNKHLDEDCYQDPNHKIIAQDILYITLDHGLGTVDEETEYETSEATEFNQKTELMNHSKNTILYGPPGTGKTYRTKARAVSIIEGKQMQDIDQLSKDEVNKKYKEYQDGGFIAFTTFHQSTTYEDFIEGIKPEMEKKTTEDSQIAYSIQNGVFKNLNEKAKESVYLKEKTGTSNPVLDKKKLDHANFYKISLGDSQNPAEDEIYSYCIENDCIAIGYGNGIDFSDVVDENEIKQKFKNQGIDGNYNLFAIKCLRHWMKKGDLVFVSYGNKKLRAIGEVTGDYFFDPNAGINYDQFRKVKWHYFDLEIPVQNALHKQFSPLPIYLLGSKDVKKEFFQTKEEVDSTQAVNHVLIIDEINRGNIANIFGELITLIEEDKREQRDNHIAVTLPYSKNKFSVASNIHLLGTMNTADRSIEALDTALRRRFSFEAFHPSPEVLNQEGIAIDGLELDRMLTIINQRIEKLLDRDHTIGHAYFFKLKDAKEKDKPAILHSIFHNNILPLLQEYFYGDFAKIGMVLGPDFVEKQDDKINMHPAFSHDDQELLNERTVYRVITPYHIIDACRSIYESKEEEQQ